MARARKLPRLAPSPEVVRRLETVPLSTRVVAIVVTLTLAALTVTSLATAWLLHRDLMARMDADLRVAAHAATSSETDLTTPTLALSTYAVALVPLDGSPPEVMVPIPLRNSPPQIPQFTADDARVLQHNPFTVESTQGDISWRLLASTDQSTGEVLVVGFPLTSIQATERKLLALTLTLGAAATISAAVLGFFLMRRAFRPLRRIEDTAAAIAAGDLSRRVPERHSHDEVASLSRSLNMMLTQVERSFAAQEASEARMRQFIADASHELRTPLVTVRGYAELYRHGALTKPEDVRSSMGRIESEAGRMSGLVEDLLTLARLDEQRPMEMIQVDLVELASEAVHDARIREPGRQITLAPLGDDLQPTFTTGDPARLRQVLVNLVANAFMHTPEGTPIEVRVGNRGDRAEIQVVDHGEGMDEETAARIFERFYRADRARSRERGGSGLGLAIVAAIVHRHEGRVGVAQTPGGGATFAVRLPAVDNSDG